MYNHVQVPTANVLSQAYLDHPQIQQAFSQTSRHGLAQPHWRLCRRGSSATKLPYHRGKEQSEVEFTCLQWVYKSIITCLEYKHVIIKEKHNEIFRACVQLIMRLTSFNRY